MTSPSPRGVTRSLAFDIMAVAIPVRAAHWSFDPKRDSAQRRENRAARRRALLRSL